MAHTPGPWFEDKAECRIASRGKPTRWLDDDGVRTVISMVGAMGGDDVGADTALIVAAPSMLAGLERARSSFHLLASSAKTPEELDWAQRERDAIDALIKAATTIAS